MINITLPDGSVRQYEVDVTGLDIAKSIGEGLAKAALAIEINGSLQDLYIPIKQDTKIRIITAKDQEGIEILRHDTAHIFAQSLKEIYPDAQIAIGPDIEHGFYYDFESSKTITPEDFPAIESKMNEIIKRNIKIQREEWDRDEAIKFFEKQGEYYKVELIQSIPQGEKISFYRQGDFIDLCRGPHAPSTGYKKAFKLYKVAGAYWRGDSKNKMLQRVYGYAFADEKQLKEHIFQVEEAEKRDHRKIGKELDLFHIQEEAQGMIFWHDNGYTIYRIVEEYIREKLKKHDYLEVKTPILVDRILWEKSGHWEKFRENMFISHQDDDKVMAVKPMNCPCHVQIFNQGIKSYRDLPIRMAEFGMCHRNEPTGSLHGLMRVRGFIQDDAHIFCEENQINEETLKFCALLKEVYKDFGFTDIKVKFSDRPEVRAGTDATWDKAESALREAVEKAGLEYTMNPGEGAFYGPKLEFVLKDAIGRDWQCGTLQVDFILPERLDANYIGSDGKHYKPVMLHRAILGSLERFIAILIENYSGVFPLWLAPKQVAITTITNAADSYAEKIQDLLSKKGLRTIIDTSNDKISYKIRNYSLKKIPYIITVGAKEMENDSLSVRKFGSNEQYNISIDEFIDNILKEIEQKI